MLAPYAKIEKIQDEIILPLDENERLELRNLEVQIEQNLKGFYTVGKSLKEIREKRLYREWDTFQDYCIHRWGIGRSYADRQITAAGVIEHIISENYPPPQNECQVRPLTRLPKEEQLAAWKGATERAEDSKSKITAKMVEQSIAAIKTDEPADGPELPVLSDYLSEQIQSLTRLMKKEIETGSTNIAGAKNAMTIIRQFIRALERGNGGKNGYQLGAVL